MKCYCYETEMEFVFCAEDVDVQYEENLLHAWFEKVNHKFVKAYPKDFDDRELIGRNFALLAPLMFEGTSAWESALRVFAEKCGQHGIRWSIIGSVSEAVLGVAIAPHDIDIVVHTDDFYRVRDVFQDAMIEPFVDNKGVWLVRYFGRLCLMGVMLDIAADEKMNMENRPYDRISWSGFDLLIEPMQVRYQTELDRKRGDRIKAIEDYMQHT